MNLDWLTRARQCEDMVEMLLTTLKVGRGAFAVHSAKGEQSARLCIGYKLGGQLAAVAWMTEKGEFYADTLVEKDSIRHSQVHQDLATFHMAVAQVWALMEQK